MSPNPSSTDASLDPAAEIEQLRARLAEAEAVLDAIRSGRIDALLVSGQRGEQVFTLKHAEHDYRLLVEEMGEGALTLTANGLIYFANRRLAAMLGVAPEQLLGSALADHIAAADRPRYLAWLHSPSPRPQQRLEMDLIDARGMALPCHLSFTELPVAEKQGAFCVVATDLSARKQAEEALRVSEQRLKTIVENLPIGVWFLDAAGKIVYGNATAQRIWNGARFVGPDHFGDYRAWAPHMDRPLNAEEWSATRAIRHGETRLNEELEIECFDGTRKTILNSAVPIRDGNGRIAGAVVLNQDITERKAAEDRIERLAFYDSLTGLPNRRLLLDRLGQIQATIKRHGGHGALLFIDLDHFKDLNDSLGHDVGDLLLIQVAQRLRTCIRGSDTVARLGGDEFVVVLGELSNETAQAMTQARHIGLKVLQTLSQPYQLGTHVHHSTPSIGATLIDTPHSSVEELLKRADLAMYQSKNAGRNQLRFFDPQMQTALELRTHLEGELYDGLHQDQLQLYYQPQVDANGRIFGAEALLRWNHPQRGLLTPEAFIHLAETSGFILELGAWVLDAACAQLARWSTRHGAPAASIAINISARQFLDPGFVEQVQAALQRHGVDPHRLTLELTESLLLQDIDDTIAKMSALRALGLRFALDDFGTGYSSLAYLKRLPLDQLKIDRSFVADVITDVNDAAIVRAILALAPKLGLSVIAEGVETEAQRRFLVEDGCRAFQGYLFGKPAPAKDIGL
ncbi:MAG: putative bifunctional diguanylate cyclase/phosphodiesterase [Halochromatium sp.]